MDIFQNDTTEELIKFYHITRGHSQGEIEEVYFLITSLAVYVLRLKDESNVEHKYIKEAIINHNEFDYVEVRIITKFSSLSKNLLFIYICI
jgi:site-specific DNA-adenine methylase